MRSRAAAKAYIYVRACTHRACACLRPHRDARIVTALPLWKACARAPSPLPRHSSESRCCTPRANRNHWGHSLGARYEETPGKLEIRVFTLRSIAVYETICIPIHFIYVIQTEAFALCSKDVSSKRDFFPVVLSS